MTKAKHARSSAALAKQIQHELRSPAVVVSRRTAMDVFKKAHALWMAEQEQEMRLASACVCASPNDGLVLILSGD